MSSRTCPQLKKIPAQAELERGTLLFFFTCLARLLIAAFGGHVVLTERPD